MITIRTAALDLVATVTLMGAAAGALWIIALGGLVAMATVIVGVLLCALTVCLLILFDYPFPDLRLKQRANLSVCPRCRSEIPLAVIARVRGPLCPACRSPLGLGNGEVVNLNDRLSPLAIGLFACYGASTVVGLLTLLKYFSFPMPVHDNIPNPLYVAFVAIGASVVFTGLGLIREPYLVQIDSRGAFVFTGNLGAAVIFPQDVSSITLAKRFVYFGQADSRTIRIRHAGGWVVVPFFQRCGELLDQFTRRNPRINVVSKW